MRPPHASRPLVALRSTQVSGAQVSLARLPSKKVGGYKVGLYKGPSALGPLLLLGAMSTGCGPEETDDGVGGAEPALSTSSTTTGSSSAAGTATAPSAGTTTAPSAGTTAGATAGTATAPPAQPTAPAAPTSQPSDDTTSDDTTSDDVAPEPTVETDDATIEPPEPADDGVSTDGVGGAPNPNTDAGGGDVEPVVPAAGGASNPPSLGNDEMPWFSFFTTSLQGLLELAPDKVNGFGGDLGGLAGADEICRQLALQSNPTDAKTWRAFLSTGGFDGNEPVDAIDRIGDGPWYDYNGRLLAENLEGLIPGEDGRPSGDPQLAEMFSDEYGEPIRASDDIDNHDSLTGSGPDGRLYTEDDAGELATCADWTDNTLRDEQVAEGGGGGGTRGRVPVGHAWPRSESNGRNWVQDHTVNGCEPGVFIAVGGGAPSDNFTVGGGGGYGAFYCFALEGVAP
jgi:hypothetical protein